MPKKERILNQRKRRVFRTRIANGEVGFGAVFTVIVLGMGLWFLAQRDHFDPSERDISMEVMEENSVKDTLYRKPLERWVDPAQASAPGAPSVDLGIFPPGILEGSWSPATRVQVFDESNLYEKINGAAPQYFQFGFETLHYLGIEQPAEGLELSIELYDMGAFQNALGIFAAQRDAAREVKALPPLYFYKTEVGVIGIVNRFYFKLTGSDESPVVGAKAQQVMDALPTLPGSDGEPPPLFIAFRDVLHIPFEGIAYEKTDAFQFQFAKDFWFGRPDNSGDLRYYVHEAASEDEADDLFRQLVTNNLYDYDEVLRDEQKVVLKHKYLDTYMAMERTGKLIYGFDGAPQDLNSEETLSTLRSAF